MRQMATKRSLWFAICLQLLFFACERKEFTQENTSAVSAGKEEPQLKANDRPTETGAGVPGYLVSCSVLDTAPVDQVHVGCGLVDQDNARVKSTPDAWTRYSLDLPETAPSTLAVTKRASDKPEEADVVFEFAGLEKKLMLGIAMEAQFGYTYRDAKGTVQVLKATMETPASAPAATEPVTPDCKTGVVRDGVCYFRTSMSCAAACERSNLKAAAAVIDTIGMGSAANAQNCEAVYKQIYAGKPVRFMNIRTAAGLGCHQAPSGLLLFDLNITRTGTYPAIGGNRICACE